MIDNEVEKVGMKMVFIMTTGIGGYDFVFGYFLSVHFRINLLKICCDKSIQ